MSELQRRSTSLRRRRYISSHASIGDGVKAARVVEALTPSPIGAIRRVRRRRSDVRHCHAAHAVAPGRAVASCSSGPPARRLGGGSAGRCEARDGSAAAGRRKRNGFALPACARRRRQPASSAARGQPADSLFTAGQGGGPNERDGTSPPNLPVSRADLHAMNARSRNTAARRSVSAALED